MRGLGELRTSYIRVIILDYTSHTPDGNQILIYPIWADVVKRIWWAGITIGASEVYAHLISLEDDNSRSMKQHQKQTRSTKSNQKQRDKNSPTPLPPCQTQRWLQTGRQISLHIFSHQDTCTSEEQQSFPPRVRTDFSTEAWEIQDPLNLLLGIKKQNIKSILFGSFHYSLRKHTLQINSTKHNFIALLYHLPRREVGKQLTVKLIWQPPIT